MKKYQPTTGTEGCMFYEDWCAFCIHEPEDYEEISNGKGCEIFSMTMVREIEDPRYPKEWIYGSDDIPKCTAYQFRDTRPDGLKIDEDANNPNQLKLF